MTILRDQETSRGDFIFYADRLSTLVVEKALSFIPYQQKEVRTPVGINHGGMEAVEKVRPLASLLHLPHVSLSMLAHTAWMRYTEYS